MPAITQRPPIQIGSLESEGPTPQPATPPTPVAPVEATPHTTTSGAGAASPFSHWAEPSSELGGAAKAPDAQAPQSAVASAHPLAHWAEPTSDLGGGAGTTATANPLAGKRFYVDPSSNAQRQADAWRNTRPGDAAQMDKIAKSPQATWLTGGGQNVEGDVENKVTAAKAQGTVPVFVAYNIPNRDIGQFSAGGVEGTAEYKAWVDKVAAGIKGDPAVVILEPDALAQADKLPPAQQQERYAMMRDAVTTLKKAGATVYLDAGNPEWKQPPDMAKRLQSAGIAGADGFALNTSNFFTTEANEAYGTAISAQLGGKHFVIDTSRNGVGPTPDRQWCNPAGRALGQTPTTDTGNPLVDAFLWAKNPGESDGTANGGLPAGSFMPEYALDLAQRQPSATNPSSAPTAMEAAPSPAPAAAAHPLLNLHLSPLPPAPR